MTNFPNSLDTDITLIRIDDNITEIGSTAINQLRSAMFAVEKNIGLGAQGSLSSISERLNVSFNSDGTIRASALTSIGLASLPIDNAEIGENAGIKEYKLSLDYSTSNLNTLIQTNKNLLDTLIGFTTDLDSKVSAHIGGSSNPLLRHVASQIDLNDVPVDSRDPGYNWPGLIDYQGNQLPATTVAEALYEINQDLVNHQNNTTGTAHTASGIGVDTTNFKELSQNSDNVQKALNNIDDINAQGLGIHRATMHGGAVPKDARSMLVGEDGYIQDGYTNAIVPATLCVTHVAHYPPGTNPVDNSVTGDLIVTFQPTNTNFLFDSQFSQVKAGDEIRINYGFGLEDIKKIDSVAYAPGSIWTCRVTSPNLIDSDGYADGYAYAAIYRERYDPITQGVLACAPVNAQPSSTYSNILGSITIGTAFGATVFGNGFDPNQIDNTHYNLYLQLYPNGKANVGVVNLPVIDITGNLGATPGQYTLDSIVQSTNNAFHGLGYNYRFIAFAFEGNFGLMLADAIDGASFSIINGTIASGVLLPGSFTNNVIGNDRISDLDALGLGNAKANYASPSFTQTYVDSTAAQFPTKIIYPYSGRNYVANGALFDRFRPKPLTIDSFWAADITSKHIVGLSTEVTYTVQSDLATAGLMPGKTILVQPANDTAQNTANTVDYGRFIIKDVTFVHACAPLSSATLITVLNGIHGTGSGTSTSSPEGTPVRLYFSEDSVGFSAQNVVDQVSAPSNYHRNFEIYVNDNQQTFSHERARLPFQVESATFLGTNNFHLTSVSPKLRGYTETVVGIYRKFVRLYINNYDSISGEFDGYLGRRPIGGGPPTISLTGPISSGRKNEPVRFYDETAVDYIELIFNEIAIALPGTAILTTAAARYVDIEIFDSLALDEELTLLATCEVNWMPISGTNIIERIVDRRQRGSVTELEFTQSAKDYISSATRGLNVNGIFRGFEYQSINANDSRELFFNGGSALVNGCVVTANQNSVTIPQVYTESETLPETLDYAVCVNQSGNYSCILLTDTKQQFFAKDTISGNSYYIPSVTFSELVTTRQDICIFASVNVTIASVTINSITDARKFVALESSNIPLTLVRNDITTGVNINVGHFNTFEQVKAWAKGFGSKLYLQLKGSIVIDQTVNLTDLTTGLVIDGTNADVYVTAKTGFIVRNNIRFQNVKFNYNAVFPSYNDIDLANLIDGYACILGDATSADAIDDIDIDNCVFNRTVGGYRSPHIMMSMVNASFAKRVRIKNNKFLNNTIVPYDINNCAIAFYADGTGVASYATMEQCFISDNIMSGQSILCLAENVVHGLAVFDTKISNNTSVSVIGYRISGAASGTPELIIEGNSSIIICTAGPNGKSSFVNDITAGSGYVKILNNKCSNIYCAIATDAAISVSRFNMVIAHNTLTSSSTASIATWGLTENRGIFVSGTNRNNIAEIYENVINSSVSDVYIAGIYCFNMNFNIHHNQINRFIEYGIYYPSEMSGQGITTRIVSNNIINRFDGNVIFYISIINTCTITDNRLDTRTTDGTSTNTIEYIPSNAYIDRNVNHIKSLKIGPGAIGTFMPAMSFFPTTAAYNYVKTPASVPAADVISLISSSYVIGSFIPTASVVFGLTGSASATWYVLLSSVIPIGSRIVSIQGDVSVDNYTQWSLADCGIRLYEIGNGTEITNSTYSFTTSSTNSVTLLATDPLLNRIGSGMFFIFFVTGNSIAGSTSFTITNVVITYTY